MPLVCALGLLSFVACKNEEQTNSTTDSLSNSEVSTTTSGTEMQSGSYVDLYTGSPVEVSKDEQSGKYMNKKTNEPVYFYINTSTNDTFDVLGRIVNNALIKLDDGKYQVDDARVKIDSDGDIKIKEEDGDKIKMDASSGNVKVKEDGTKEKFKDDKYKMKNDSVKIKIKDDKVKIKTSNK